MGVSKIESVVVKIDALVIVALNELGQNASMYSGE